MSNRDAALIACRILAIYLFARGLMQLTFLPYLFQGAIDRSIGFQVLMIVLSPLVLLVLAGLLLWLHSEKLAGHMVPQAQPLDGSGIKLSARGLQAIAFSVAGAVILVNAVAGLFQAVPGLAVVLAQGGDPWQYHLHSIFLIVEKLVLLILGLILFLGGKTIAALLKLLYTRAREF